MSDGRWDKRSLFVETEVTEKDAVVLGLALAEGTYTIQEAEAIIRRLEKGVAQAKRIRALLKNPNKRSKK